MTAVELRPSKLRKDKYGEHKNTTGSVPSERTVRQTESTSSLLRIRFFGSFDCKLILQISDPGSRI